MLKKKKGTPPCSRDNLAVKRLKSTILPEAILPEVKEEEVKCLNAVMNDEDDLPLRLLQKEQKIEYMSGYIEELEAQVHLLRTKNIVLCRNQDQQEILRLKSIIEELKMQHQFDSAAVSNPRPLLCRDDQSHQNVRDLRGRINLKKMQSIKDARELELVKSSNNASVPAGETYFA